MARTDTSITRRADFETPCSSCCSQAPCHGWGCPYSFGYGGTNSFAEGNALAAAYTTECVGGAVCATQQYDAQSQYPMPPEELYPLQGNDPPDTSLYYPADFYRARCEATDFNNEQRARQDEACKADYDGDYFPRYRSRSGSATVCSYRTVEDRMSTPVQQAAGTETQWHDVEPEAVKDKTYLPIQRKRKRNKAQRYALLNEDPWTGAVSPHSVVCRGCNKTIQLDARNDYYPGLWEKHRDGRCDGVKRALAEERRVRSVQEAMWEFMEEEVGTSGLLTLPESYCRQTM
ncbi:hypothetical protein DFH06DRAFT_1318914 [Mycena polygramma]|nr:hypothetical protein DFH06DRAFT_1318914 [Mycena polygramma]